MKRNADHFQFDYNNSKIGIDQLIKLPKDVVVVILLELDNFIDLCAVARVSSYLRKLMLKKQVFEKWMSKNIGPNKQLRDYAILYTLAGWKYKWKWIFRNFNNKQIMIMKQSTFGKVKVKNNEQATENIRNMSDEFFTQYVHAMNEDNFGIDRVPDVTAIFRIMYKWLDFAGFTANLSRKNLHKQIGLYNADMEDEWVYQGVEDDLLHAKTSFDTHRQYLAAIWAMVGWWRANPAGAFFTFYNEQNGTRRNLFHVSETPLIIMFDRITFLLNNGYIIDNDEGERTVKFIGSQCSVCDKPAQFVEETDEKRPFCSELCQIKLF